MANPRVESVNVGKPRPIERAGGELTTSAIWKEPLTGRVAVRGVNVDGDDQADRSVHGGPDQAVYAYAAEDTEWWERTLGSPLGPGAFGENLTTREINVNAALIGERWRIGTVVLEITAPRIPCWKLANRMQDPLFIKRFARSGRPGAYFRIIEEGELGAGDPIEVIERPEHDITVAYVAHVYLADRDQAERLLAAPALAAGWRNWAEARYSSTK
jgi:MOSC domain-containing protein YiiM